MERPGLGGGTLAELSDYNHVQMRGAGAQTTKNWIVNYGKTSDLLQVWLYNDYKNGNDNDLLSKVLSDSKLR